MKIKRILIIVSILAAAALACSLGAGAGSPTDTPVAVQPPDQTSPPENPTSEPAGGDEPASSLNLEDPALYNLGAHFNTYRTALDFNFTAEGPVTATALIDSATRIEPYATTLSFYSAGNDLAAGEGAITITQILDTQYFVIEGLGCQTVIPGAQVTNFGDMLELGGMLTGEAAFAGEGNANGIDTYIYTPTMDNIDPLDQIGQDIRSISNAELHIARDGGFIVRLLLEGRGVNRLLNDDPDLEGDLRFELNLYDFDTPLTIEAPAACAAPPETTSEIPLPEDASNISQVSPDFLTFTTGESIEDVMEFYETEMPAHGCTLQSSSGSNDAGSGTIAYEGCDFGSVQIVILAESSDVTLVNILSSP